MEIDEKIINHPNLAFAMKATEQILQIQTPINYLLLVANFDNETCGSQLINKSNISTQLTEQAKINILLQVMAEFKIPFKLLEKYGNLTPEMIHRKINEDKK